MGEAHLSQSLPRDYFLDGCYGLLRGAGKGRGSPVPLSARSSGRRERERDGAVLFGRSAATLVRSRWSSTMRCGWRRPRSRGMVF